MHKKIMIYASILLCNYTAKACDICGCAAGGSTLGLLPQIQKNYIGIRYSHQKFKTHHDNESSFEIMDLTELWAQYFIHPKVQIGITLPYAHKTQTIEPNKTTINGLGDISVMLNYKLIARTEDCFKFKHLLLLGGGIKTPTGNYQQKTEGKLILPGLQNGTGAFDFFVKTNYTIRYKNWGSNTDIQYRYNGVNSNEYSFGNKLTFQSKIFFWKKFKKNCHVLPYSGVLIDKMAKDAQNQINIQESGGLLAANTLGFECYYKKLLLSAVYLHPINQNLNLGFTKASPSFQCNLAFNF